MDVSLVVGVLLIGLMRASAPVRGRLPLAAQMGMALIELTIWLVVGAAVLLRATDVVQEQIDSTGAYDVSGTTSLLGVAGAINSLAGDINLAGMLILVLSVPFLVRGVVILRRDASRPALDLSDALNTLLDGLAEAEGREAASREELEKVRAERERLATLATLTSEQLGAIKASTSPGARFANWFAIVSLVVGLGVAAVSIWLAGDFPWQ